MVFFILIAIIAISVSADYFRNYAGKEIQKSVTQTEIGNKLQAA